MGKRRSWSDEELKSAVISSISIRQTIYKLGLIPAGGNYSLISRYIKEKGIDTSHFNGQGWRKGMIIPREPVRSLKSILVKGSVFDSHKLKIRLFKARLKKPECELCGWNAQSPDGRIPVELDHINGDHEDNRLSNLRILCPNCHSLQSTHRGRNKAIRRGDGMVDIQRLKR